MRFTWKQWNIGGKIIFVSACLALISMNLPWNSIQGARGFGAELLLFIFWIYPIIKLLKNEKIQLFIGLSCVTSSVFFTELFIKSVSLKTPIITLSGAGIGATLFLWASLALGFGIMKYKPFISPKFKS